MKFKLKVKQVDIQFTEEETVRRVSLEFLSVTGESLGLPLQVLLVDSVPELGKTIDVEIV